MSQVKYGLLCWGRANAGKISEIDKLINRALRCMHFKKWNEIIRSIKITKKKLNIINMFNYDLEVLLYKCRRIMLPVNLKPSNTEINKINKYLTIFSVENYFFQRVNSFYGFKGIGGVEHFFYKLILFNRLLSYLPDAFYSLAKFKVVFEI